MFKVVKDENVEKKLVEIICECGTTMKIEEKVIDRDEAFHCSYCRKLGFVDK